MPYKDLEKKKQWRKNNKALIQKHTDDWLKRNGLWDKRKEREKRIITNQLKRDLKCERTVLCRTLHTIVYKKIYPNGSPLKRARTYMGCFVLKVRDIRRNNKYAYETITKHKLLEIYSKFNSCCFNCGDSNNICIDHHWPKSFGTILKLNNAVLLCNSCNAKKENKEPSIFYTPKQLSMLYTQYGITKEVSDAKPERH